MHGGVESAFHHVPHYSFNKSSLASLKVGPLIRISPKWDCKIYLQSGQGSATATLWTAAAHCSLLWMCCKQNHSLWEVFYGKSLQTEVPWQGRKQKPPKGQTERYLSICSLYTSRATAKAGSEMADGLQSYCNVLSLNHHMATICRPTKLSFLLPLSVQRSHHCSIENSIFVNALLTDKITSVVLLLVIKTSSENSSSSKTCPCSSAWRVPSKNPKGTLNITSTLLQK